MKIPSSLYYKMRSRQFYGELSNVYVFVNRLFIGVSQIRRRILIEVTGQ